ncbi:MAG: esterase/lipase family protein [Akkermansiaceae bacterium]
MNTGKLNPVIILHGWSDDSESFINLEKFIKKEQNRQVDDISLVDWLSMNDDISYDDIAEAFDNEWERRKLSRDPHSYDFVVHSTGALVLRHWFVKYFATAKECPAKRILMLAPANYGSYLADEGKTFMGRIMKNGLFGIGKKLLHGLELASPYTQALADKDIFKSWYKPTNGLFVTTLIGDASLGGIKGLTHKDGSDNTVMISCGNLECIQVDYNIKQSAKEIRNRTYNTTQSNKVHKHTCNTAFGVIHKIDHSEITGNKKRLSKQLKELINSSLSVERDSWSQHKQKVASNSYLHKNPYANVVISISDKLGQPVTKYVILLSAKDSINRRYKISGVEDVHRNKVNPSRRSFYINTDRLMKSLNDKDLIMQIIADPLCEYDDSGNSKSAGYLPEEHCPEIIFPAAHVADVIHPGSTTFLNIEIPRLFNRVAHITP